MQKQRYCNVKAALLQCKSSVITKDINSTTKKEANYTENKSIGTIEVPMLLRLKIQH